MYSINRLLVFLAENGGTNGAPAGNGGKDGAAPAQGGGFTMLIVMLGAMFFIFYFLVMRPQKTQQKRLREMIDALRKGDKVVTSGGIIGTVAAVREKEVTLKVDEKNNIRMKFNKNAIASVLEDKRKKFDDEDADNDEDGADS